MKIKCDREKLLSAFQTAASVVPSRSPKPILQNVKIDAIRRSSSLLDGDRHGSRYSHSAVDGVETEVPGSALLVGCSVRIDPERKQRRDFEYRSRWPRSRGVW